MHAFWNSNFFFVVVVGYLFIGQVLQVVNPFMPGGNKAADLFKNVQPFVTTQH